MKNNPHSPYNYTPSYLLRFTSYLSIFVGVGALAVLVFLDGTPRTTEDRGSLFIVDVSLSMTVEDIAGDNSVRISRLQAVRDILKNTGDVSPRALMTFAESAKLQFPLARGDAVWDEVVDAISPITYGASTNIETALASAMLIYPNIPLDVYIFTDGEETISDATPRIILGDDMRVHIIGIGSSEGGKIINNYDSEGRIVYKKYEGKDILSKLDIGYLEELKDSYNASLTLVQNSTDSQNILALLQSTQGSAISSKTADVVYYMLAGLLVFIGLAIPDSKRK